MTVKIDYHTCNGCGQCYRECPMDVIGWDEEKDMPLVAYPDECAYCGICEIECPKKAIDITYPVMLW